MEALDQEFTIQSNISWKKDDNINKIDLYAKVPYEAKYQFLLNLHKSVALEHFYWKTQQMTRLKPSKQTLSLCKISEHGKFIFRKKSLYF